MKDITDTFGTLYQPVAALVVYEAIGTNAARYVEHFDMDANGNPINAHPLTVREANALARALNTEQEKSRDFLIPKGILPTNVLHINTSKKGSLLWYTKGCRRQLYFSDSLEIPNGIAEVPAMVWHASKQSLKVFALSTGRRPLEKSGLYHAPFFNVYEDGAVCMGTVDVDISNSASVEEFMAGWEDYFFHSYFSHLMQGHNPINGNCVSLWKDLVDTGRTFPKEALKKTGCTLKNLLP